MNAPEAPVKEGDVLAGKYRVEKVLGVGGMDTLPHNGAVITLLFVTGLTHRVSYGDIFAITCIKTLAVFVVIAFYYATGIY